MDQYELLRHLVRRLEVLKIPYHVTSTVASFLQHFRVLAKEIDIQWLKRACKKGR
jgi:hypothetical protein